MKKSIMILGSIVIIITIIYFLLTRESNMRNPVITKSQSRTMSFGSYISDTNKNKIYETLKTTKDSFDGFFTAGGFFEEDTEFSVILLDNFKQIDFSVGGNSKSLVQSIKMPKNNDKRLQFYTYNIRFDCVGKGLNDLLLIFIQKYNRENLEYYLKRIHKSTYLTRFSILNTANITDKLTVNYDSNYKTLRGNPLEDIFIYNKEFDEFLSSDPLPYTPIGFLDNVSVGSKIKLPVTINTKSFMEGTKFYEGFVNDEKLGKKEQIAVFAIINNKLSPLGYGKCENEVVHFYEKEMGETIMITPQVELSKSGLNACSIIALSYPFTQQEPLMNTYKITKWSTAVVSNELYINVTENK